MARITKDIVSTIIFRFYLLKVFFNYDLTTVVTLVFIQPSWKIEKWSGTEVKQPLRVFCVGLEEEA